MGDKVFEGKKFEKKDAAGERELNINIKINPKKIFKFFTFVILLVFVFSLGRFTADLGGAATAGTGNTLSASSFSLTGWFAGIGGDDEEETETTAAAEEVAEETVAAEEAAAAEEPVAEVETAGAETAEETEEAAAEEEAEEEEEVEEDEIIITSYSQVAVSLTGVQKQWKGTWGKITHISYTIKNSEEGTIKPSYFMMNVEGYNEEAEKKKITLPASSQDVKAGQIASGTVAVPGGFNYNQKSVGPLENVRVTVILYDGTNKPMASYTKEYNLQG